MHLCIGSSYLMKRRIGLIFRLLYYIGRVKLIHSNMVALQAPKLRMYHFLRHVMLI